MLSGINTDVEHRGKTYHVQTEDGGERNPLIVTHLFSGGAILSSKKTSYAELVKSGLNPDVIREMMKEQHQGMIKSLTVGQIDGGVAAEPAVPTEEASPQPSPPPPPLPRGRRTLDDVIDEFLDTRPQPPPSTT